MATVEELRNYAVDTLGLTVSSRATKTEIQALIDGETGETTKEVPDAKVSVVKADDKGKRTPIILQSTQSDKRPLIVAVNGFNYSIPRDIRVDVPEEVIEVLNNAVETHYDMENNKTEVRAHQFSRI